MPSAGLVVIFIKNNIPIYFVFEKDMKCSKKHYTSIKPCLDLMMSFKNCIRIRIAIFWRHVCNIVSVSYTVLIHYMI